MWTTKKKKTKKEQEKVDKNIRTAMMNNETKQLNETNTTDQELLPYYLPFMTYHIPSSIKDLIALNRETAWETIEKMREELYIVIAL